MWSPVLDHDSVPTLIDPHIWFSLGRVVHGVSNVTKWTKETLHSWESSTFEEVSVDHVIALLSAVLAKSWVQHLKCEVGFHLCRNVDIQGHLLVLVR